MVKSAASKMCPSAKSSNGAVNIRPHWLRWIENNFRRSVAALVHDADIIHPTTRASPSWNDTNPRSRLLYYTVARISVLVRTLRANLVFDCLALVWIAPANDTTALPSSRSRPISARSASRRQSRPFASERFSPGAPAPAAPPLPARRATHRSKPDGSAREPRRSMFPSTCRLR
jgi:hypothetical protein